MSFLHQYNGFGPDDLEVDDEIFDSYSSNNESILDDCYIEEAKISTMTNSQTTTTKLKKAAKSSLSSYEPSSSTSRNRISGDSTISSTAQPPAPTRAPSSSCFATFDGEGRKKKAKTKRSVRFSRADECFFVLPLTKYSERELKKCWYTRSDIIRRDASLDLIALRIEEKKEPKKHETFRGLEELDMEYRTTSEERRFTVVQAVLNAQKEHADQRDDHGVVDPLFLAVASIELTVDSKADALERGMKDMLEVLPLSFDSKKPRHSLPVVDKTGTIVDPFCVPDRPRRNSAPASSLQQNKLDSKEIMEALALFDDMDVSAPPPPPPLPAPGAILSPQAGKSNKRSSSPSRRHSLDSSSKHNKSKSRSRSSFSSSPGKVKSNASKSLASPNPKDSTRSPVKKKARPSVSEHTQPSPKKKESKSRSSSKSPSSGDRKSSSRRFKLPFAPFASNSPSSPGSQKESSRKKLVASTPMSSPRCSITKTKNPEPQTPESRIVRGTSNSSRIHAPTPPRQDPPGMFQRISSIRLDEQYPPTVPRL